ncbi:MAG: rod shape-determining protein RodA [Chitinophagales bacterium]
MARQESIAGKIDWLTVFIYILLVLMGWMAIYSAVYTDEGKSIFDSSINSGKQFQWMIASAVLAFIVLIVDSRFYTTFAYIFFGFILLFVLSVFVLGTKVKGQANWIRLGSFQMQPSELAKFGTALALSKFLSTLNVDVRRWRDKWRAFAIVGIPMLIVAGQGDAGSAIVFLSFSLVLFRDGLEPYYLIVGAAVAVLSVLALVFSGTIIWGVPGKFVLIGFLFLIAAVLVYFNWRNRKTALLIAGIWIASTAYIFSVDFAFSKLKPHQRDRINVLLGKEVEEGKDWNIKQSIIAIGSGGFTGKGYLNGTQTKLKFVPEQSTDFIFSSIGEEFGFLGSIVIIALYVGLFFRLLYLAERQRSKFSRIYGYCVASILFFHFLVNMGMVIGVAPVIGIPLPFVSYGGSSLLSFTVLLFIFVRLDTQRYETMR